MRNLDSNSLQSLYESKVALRNILNEELPYEPGEMGPEKAGEQSYPSTKHKAAMDPKYGPGTSYGQPRLSEEQMKRAAVSIAKGVADYLATLPDKKFVGGPTAKEEDAAFRNEVAQVIVNKLRMKSGDPVYQKSFAVHVARQLIDTLLDANVLKYTKPAKAPKAEGEASAGAADEPAF